MSQVLEAVRTGAGDWSHRPRPRSRQEWVTRAAEVAALFAPTAIERDSLGVAPRPTEMAWLKDSGLVQLQGPREAGGGAADWGTVLAVVREFAKVEGSIANILAWHYANYWVIQSFPTAAQQVRWEAEITRAAAFLAPVANFHDSPVAARDAGENLVLNGTKIFNTGAPVADLINVGVALEGDPNVFFLLVDARLPGITYGDDWDTFGQRGTASGSVTFTDVVVPWTQAIGFAFKSFVPRGANHTPGLTAQTLMPTIYTGLARGALDQAVAYIRGHSRPWFHSEYTRAVDDPYIVLGIGRLEAHLRAAEMLAEQAGEQVSEALLHPDEISMDRRGELAVLLSASKTVATEVALEVTSGIFEFTGARSTARSFALDRFYRDVRTHTLHDPVAYKILQVGQNVLTDKYPKATDWYA
jgi:alkylation response protein AidB-like acyl-CoA dehydrogenase